MKVIGLIGGMSWESSLEYYRIINRSVKKRLGGFHSAKILMYSVDFAEIEELQTKGLWTESGEILADAAERLEKGGAEMIVLCTNTMHKLSDAITSRVRIPMIHIADAAAGSVKQQGFKKAALLGTRYTMEQDFYKDRLKYNGLDVIIPDADDMTIIHDVIYEELVKGIILDSSREKYQQIIEKLKNKGAEAVILGCTEIGLLIKGEDSVLPVFDTTQIHAEAAVKLALQ